MNVAHGLAILGVAAIAAVGSLTYVHQRQAPSADAPVSALPAEVAPKVTAVATSSASIALPARLSDFGFSSTDPVGVIAAYFLLQHQGDIAGAAELTTEPEASVASITAYRDRMGELEFTAKFDPSTMTVLKTVKTVDALLVVLSDSTQQKYINAVVKEGNLYKVANAQKSSRETMLVIKAELAALRGE